MAILNVGSLPRGELSPYCQQLVWWALRKGSSASRQRTPQLLGHGEQAVGHAVETVWKSDLCSDFRLCFRPWFQVGQFISGYGGSGLGTSPQRVRCVCPPVSPVE